MLAAHPRAMVLATTGESTAAKSVLAADKSRVSTKSRASRSSRRKNKSRSGGWYCCPCPITTVLRGGGGGSAPCSGGGGGGGVGGQPGGTWPEPAKFYCCRADLVAAMARERSASNNNESQAGKAMDEDPDDGVVIDYDDDDLGSFDEIAEEALPDDTFREVFDRSHQHDPDERWQIQEPDLPYVENLPHQLDVGRAIVVEGVVLPDAMGFAVNLSCGAGQTPDIAFHFNPRLDRSFVARNSRTKGSWGEEEAAALGGSPFRRGQQFMIHILVTATGFKLSVDRMHFCNFQFRMPLSKVCRLEIHGDIIVSTIQHTRLEVYPERPLDALPEHTFSTIPTDHIEPWNSDLSKENLFIGRLKPNLSSGLEITIQGRMKLLPQSFYINLQQGCQLWPHPNVHLHLNPRFAAEDYEHVVVANTWLQGSWGNEQRYSRCRFRPGEPFTVVIYVEEQRYRIMVDGMQQATLSFRAPPSHVDTVVVRGDVIIKHISISKSRPPVERLPSSVISSENLFESFVHIPRTMSSESITEASVSETDSPSFLSSPLEADQQKTEVCPAEPIIGVDHPHKSTTTCENIDFPSTLKDKSADENQSINCSEVSKVKEEIANNEEIDATAPVQGSHLSDAS